MGFDPKTMNTTALAYIGDAVYEIYVRERVLAASGAARGACRHKAARKRRDFDRQKKNDRRLRSVRMWMRCTSARSVMSARTDRPRRCAP